MTTEPTTTKRANAPKPFSPRMSDLPSVGAKGPLLLQRLLGATLNPAWLPEGLSPALDELRAEQHEQLHQLHADTAALKEIEAKFAAEDEAYDEAMRDASRRARGRRQRVRARPDHGHVRPHDRAPLRRAARRGRCRDRGPTGRARRRARPDR